MKTVATLNGRHPRVNILKTLPKLTAKKQDKKQNLSKPAQKKDKERGAALAKPAFLTPDSKNMVGLRRSERLKSKEQVSYSEEIGDF